MAAVLPNGRNYFASATGAPLVGGKLYTYIPGTSTPKDTYTTSAASVANTNPVILNSRGEANIYWVGAYDVVLKDASDVTIWGPERVEEPATDAAFDTFVSDLADTTSTAKGDALVGVKRITGSAVGMTLHAWHEAQMFNVKEFGAVGDGTADDTDAINDAIDAIKASASTGGTIYFPTGVYRLNTGLTITGTHGMRFLGDAPSYAAGSSTSPTKIKFYGSGSAITLSGLLAAQSAFRLENIWLENVGNPGVGNGIVASAAGFTGGLEVVGCSILEFDYGVKTQISPAFSYQHFKNSAFYFNTTWGIACSGDNILFEANAFSNNGPDYTTGGNALSSTPVGGGVLIDTYSTNIHFYGGNHIEGHRVAIFARDCFGLNIQGCYFEAQSKASITALNIVGLQIGPNYYNPNSEAHTIVLDNCSAVKVTGSGYGQQVYVNGCADYEFANVTTKFIDTGWDRSVENADFLMMDRYGSGNIDINDQDLTYEATPSGGSLTNITGPTLQSEIGPFGAPINRYVATAGGYFYSTNVTCTTGQYLYFSVLIRNATVVQPIVRDTSESNPIIVKTSFTPYSKDWGVLTVGGVVPANATYRMTLVIVGGETFDLGGIVHYVNATPIYKPIFSFANYRRTVNQQQSPRTVTGATDTVLVTDSGIIANRAGTVTLTLLSAASYPGKMLMVRTIQAQTVVSASSNVVPSAGGAAGTAILAATAGKWAMLQSDGTNWQVMMAN